MSIPIMKAFTAFHLESQHTQSAFTCSKLIKTLEQGVKYVLLLTSNIFRALF